MSPKVSCGVLIPVTKLCFLQKLYRMDILYYITQCAVFNIV